MKLRIENNTLRFRLTEVEVKRFADAGRHEAAIRLGAEPNQFITYGLEASDNISETTVRYHEGHITVIVPSDEVRQWANGSVIALSAEYCVGKGANLTILIEKDLGRPSRKNKT